MKKRTIISGIIIILLIIGGGILWNFNQAVQGKRIGLNLDCSRIYYTPHQIEEYIDILHAHHGNYLQLHLTDNENFGIENKYLGQTTSNARLKNGIYYNRVTNQPFLSKQQLSSIIKYAQSKGVTVVPEIELPGHAQALLNLLKATHPELVSQVEHSPQEMYYQKSATLQLSENILREYVHLLPAKSYLATGGDEIVINKDNDQQSIVNYENNLDQFLNQYHLKMTVWNDCIQKSVLSQYHKNILVNYWTLTGNLLNEAENQANAEKRATVPEINQAGLKTINCNADYTYIIMNKGMDSARQTTFKQNLKHFNSQKWNGTTNQQDSNHNNVGTLVSVWGDPTAHYTGQQALRLAKPLIIEFLDNVK